MTRIVLILGSAPNAVEAQEWARGAITDVVAVNNAWRIRSDWDYFIHPDDLPADRFPPEMTGRQVTSAAYVPIQNAFGGLIYAGGTMAFTAGYWALGALRPTVMAFFGCDMVYTEGSQTHFSGKGAADPLRDDITLRSLEAKAARLQLLAAREGCACVNLSAKPSRLVFPRANLDALSEVTPITLHTQKLEALLAREAALGYSVPSGKYWLSDQEFDTAQIDQLDAAWLKAFADHETD